MKGNDNMKRNTKLQQIRADTAEELLNRTQNMRALGYIPVGGIFCKTEERTIEHNIKGNVIEHCPYYIQTFWRTPADCDSGDLLTKAVNLLYHVQTDMAKVGEHFCDLDHAYVLDKDIATVVDDFMNGREY